MKDFAFNDCDVHWGYSEKTGAIPFIINDKKTRLKQLEDDFVLDITVDAQASNPLNSAVNTLSAYYEQDMSYVGFTAMFAHVNMFQNLRQFGLQRLGGFTKIGWNLRSNALSFSINLRYSSVVVAPIV